VLLLGLTGGIAMGKSTAAAMLRRLRVPVHDADAAVHRLLAHGGAAVAAVEAAFPGVVKDGGVDRLALGARVFGDTPALRRLEAILHPLARQSAHRFLLIAARRRAPLVVLDIPLLFESRSERRVDAVMTIWAPAFLQRARAMARPGMTAGKLDAIVARQTPDCVKRARADFAVPSSLGRAVTLRGIRGALRRLRSRRAKAWTPGTGLR